VRATTAPLPATPWPPTKLVAWLDGIEPAVERLNLFELLELPPTLSGEHVQAAYHNVARTRHPDLFRGKLSARDAERLMRIYGRIAAAYATLRDPEERNRYLYTLRNARGPVSTMAPTAVPDRGDAPPRGRGTDAHFESEGAGGGTGTAPLRARGPTTLPRPGTTSAPPPRAAAAGSSTSLPAAARSETRPRPALTRPPRAPTLKGAPSPPGPAAPLPGEVNLSPRAAAFYRRAEVALAGGDIGGAVLNLRMAASADPTSAFLREALAAAQARLK